MMAELWKQSKKPEPPLTAEMLEAEGIPGRFLYIALFYDNLDDLKEDFNL